jgi:hypothetical protein
VQDTLIEGGIPLMAQEPCILWEPGRVESHVPRRILGHTLLRLHKGEGGREGGGREREGRTST